MAARPGCGPTNWPFPALKLSRPPAKVGTQEHALGFASHAIFTTPGGVGNERNPRPVKAEKHAIYYGLATKFWPT
jgi:hypothetical protein